MFRNPKVGCMRLGAMLLALSLILGVAAQQSQATVITLGTASTVNNLFTGTPTAIGTTSFVEAVTSTFTVDIYSQAYKYGSKYAYLYQLKNVSTSPDPLEIFTLAPFTGATSSVSMGYLTGGAPTGFVSGAAIAPESTGNFNASGPLLTFYYTSRAGNQIDPGQHSAVMYVLSDQAPSVINGNVIDGSTATELVVGPVPEPATMVLLALGGLTVLVRRRRR